jgi:hypothetical protein
VCTALLPQYSPVLAGASASVGVLLLDLQQRNRVTNAVKPNNTTAKKGMLHLTGWWSKVQQHYLWFCALIMGSIDHNFWWCKLAFTSS